MLCCVVKRSEVKRSEVKCKDSVRAVMSCFVFVCVCLCVCLVHNPVSRIGTWDVEKEYHNKSKNCWCFWVC